MGTDAEFKALKRRAMEIDSQVRNLKSAIDRNWAELGEFLKEVHRKELWQYMGKDYEDIEDWRKAVDLPRSTFYEALRTFENLEEHVPKAKLKKIPKQNAKQLAKLPEAKRKDPKIIEQAITLSETKFVEATAVHRTDTASAEVRTSLHFGMTLTQKEVVESGMDDFARRNGLPVDNRTKLLELMSATSHAEGKILKKFSVWAGLVSELGRLYRGNMSLDEVHEKMAVPLEKLILETANIAAMIPSEENAEAAKV